MEALEDQTGLCQAAHHLQGYLVGIAGILRRQWRYLLSCMLLRMVHSEGSSAIEEQRCGGDSDGQREEHWRVEKTWLTRYDLFGANLAHTDSDVDTLVDLARWLYPPPCGHFHSARLLTFGVLVSFAIQDARKYWDSGATIVESSAGLSVRLVHSDRDEGRYCSKVGI